MDKYVIKLGDIKSSEKLIFDLYIDLRKRINAWAAITKQTAQARMGYVGQHLVSVVTGYPGGKSGARGHDIVLPDNEYAEIKTCYRVDQLGRCNNCDARIASIERVCPDCGSHDIKRNDDSKWLIGIRHKDEFAAIAEPKSYYLVLFEFVDLTTAESIRASIWEIDPKSRGFLYCMVDYYLNIKSNSKSGAPFNLWPYQLKFCLMRPMLIYESTISTTDDSVITHVFPGRNNPKEYPLRPLYEYKHSQNLTINKVRELARILKISLQSNGDSKKSILLEEIQQHINENQIKNEIIANAVAKAIYWDDIKAKINTLPHPLKTRIGNA